MKRQFSSVWVVVAAVFGFAAADVFGQAKPAAPAPASSSSPAARLPQGANAAMTVDVAKLIASPWGKEAKLQAKLASGYADRPLPVPPTAKRVTVGALVHPFGMEAMWQAAVIELPGAPRLETMLRAQGGYLDQIGGIKAAWTPGDVFYLALDDHTLGVARPGQRQLVTRWIAAKDKGGAAPYVSSALAAGAGADAVFAINLDDVVGLTALNYALDMGQLPSIEKIENGQDKLLAALASVKGATITIRATNTLNAECAIDFEQDVSALGAQAEPLVKDVLGMADAYEADMEKWEFKVAGKRIVGKRTMDEQSLSRLLALLSPPHVSDAVHASAQNGDGVGEAQPAADKSPGAMAAASQQYYKAIAKKLDTISPKSSPTQSAGAFFNQARSIQQLPMLNVDPALLDWGNAVADAFTQAGQELALGQQKAKVASQGVASPVAYSSYDASGYSSGTSSAETRAAYRNAQQQRRAVSQAERGAAADRAFGILNQVLSTRGKIRADMTQKYGVEF